MRRVWAVVFALGFVVGFLAGCEARRCQDSVRVLPYVSDDVVCDPTATATLTTTTDGRTVVVCTCPKEGAADMAAEPGAVEPNAATNTNKED